MANQDSKTFVDSMVDTHKNVVDTVMENTKKMANGNNLINDTIEKGSEWYKNWLDNQKNVFGKTADKAAEVTGNVKENATQMQDAYQNWMNNQTNWAKQMWEMNMGFAKNAQQTATNNAANPTAAFTNMMSDWNSKMTGMMSNMNPTNWMSQMQGMNGMNAFTNPFTTGSNPFSMDAWKNMGSNGTNIFNQWYEMLQTSFGDWQKNLQNGTTQDAYRNMVNTAEGFTRFYQMWAPMWKSIQEKNFNMDMYKQYMNPEMYKEVMDKFFGFMPENTRQYMQQFTNMMQEGMKQAGTGMHTNYSQMRDMMGNMMPAGAGQEFFTNMLNGYNNMYSNLNNAVSPIVRMMTPSDKTKNMQEWAEIANRMMIFNIKNAELQHMVYQQGTKVMDALAENLMTKQDQGTQVNSMMALYQEWLNIGDKTFVSLFESDEYSQLMAEVSALQLKLRRDFELQMEKGLANVPVATRSEMDEMYKTIYDLKKQVRQLEKMMEFEAEETTATPAAATTPTAATTTNTTTAANGTAARGKKA